MIRHFVLSSILLLTAASGTAQNLLFNADFDVNLTAWTPFADPGSTVGHDDGEDAGGDPDSGSISTTTDNPLFNSSGGFQCAGGVQAATAYDAGGRLLIPASQAGGGEAAVTVTWYSSSDCTTGFLTSGNTPNLDDSLAGFWTPSYAVFVAPPGALAARFAFVSVVTSGTAHTALFDAAIFAPQGSVPLSLFVDGFERSDTSAWHVTAP